MKAGDVILSPILSLSNEIAPIVPNRDKIFEIVRIRGNNFIKTKLTKEDLEIPYEIVFHKFKFFCTGLSIATVGHFWVKEILLNENLETIWGLDNAILPLEDLEVHNNRHRILKASSMDSAHQLIMWISLNYRRIFLYYSLGLYLLRPSSTEYIYPEALLNFFKIVEIVIYKRTKEKPKLKVILQECKKLNIEFLDESEIRKYYQIRGRDIAHDWGKVIPVDRKDVIECKMYADELIVRDYGDRINDYTAEGVLK